MILLVVSCIELNVTAKYFTHQNPDPESISRTKQSRTDLPHINMTHIQINGSFASWAGQVTPFSPTDVLHLPSAPLRSQTARTDSRDAAAHPRHKDTPTVCIHIKKGRLWMWTDSRTISCVVLSHKLTLITLLPPTRERLISLSCPRISSSKRWRRRRHKQARNSQRV